MEKLALISQAVSLSVIFYVVTYFLIIWQWPVTLLSIFLSTYFLYLFSDGQRSPFPTPSGDNVQQTRTLCATFRKMISRRYINNSGYGVSLMWLPEKFYEMLPFLYAIGGVIAISYINTPLGYISGFLLILTAVLIFMMRRDYRQGRVNKKN
jgi:hypothetical protein